MGKFNQSVNAAGTRVGNTAATPFRIWGEIINAWANIPRQGISAIKNLAEVTKQTGNALLHNFLDFSKVQGKRYQKLFKMPLNLASAVTRRPAMILWTWALSAANQGIRQPFKKLFFTPGKMFKGMRNSMRIFSKKKGFDFQTYDTHETWDIRITKNKDLGFLGAKWWSSVDKPKEEKPTPKKPNKKIKKKSEPKPDSPAPTPPDMLQKPSTPSSKPSSPKSIADVQQQQKEASAAKDIADQEKRFPQWNTLHYKEKAKYAKDFEKALEWKLTEEGVLERGKKSKTWDTIEEIMSALRKSYPTMAGYIEEEILNKNPVVISKITNSKKYTKESVLSEDQHIDWKSWNLSTAAKSFLSKEHTAKPKHIVELDWFKFYLTDLHAVDQYQWFVWFVEIDWKYEIRYFIRSWSEQLWRSMPGLRDTDGKVSKMDEFNSNNDERTKKLKSLGFNFTKNFSYERATMVDFRLWEKLEYLWSHSIFSNWKYNSRVFEPDTKSKYTKFSHYTNDVSDQYGKYKKNPTIENLPMLGNQIAMSKEINVVDDFSSLFWSKKLRQLSIDEAKDVYRKMTLGIDVPSLQPTNKKFSYYHDQFATYVTTDVFVGKLWNKDIEVYFSSLESQPDLVWIDQIAYKDQMVNSFGVSAEQINAGWLTKKPIDYSSQSPKDLPYAGNYQDYVDLRILYQENPLIKRYKELRS